MEKSNQYCYNIRRILHHLLTVFESYGIKRMARNQVKLQYELKKLSTFLCTKLIENLCFTH